MIYLFVGIAAAALLCAWLLSRRRRTEPQGWSAGPIIDGKNYSAGVTVAADGSFDFPRLPLSVHYVTKAGSLAGKSKIVMRYRIDADPSTVFVPISDPRIGVPAIGPTLYFQRAGDDGNTDGWRWWATPYAPSPIVPGEFTIEVPLAPGAWTSVETMTGTSNPEMFAAALDDCVRVGCTFGGGTGYGHGVYATGKARFSLLSFDAL